MRTENVPGTFIAFTFELAPAGSGGIVLVVWVIWLLRQWLPIAFSPEAENQIEKFGLRAECLCDDALRSAQLGGDLQRRSGRWWKPALENPATLVVAEDFFGEKVHDPFPDVIRILLNDSVNQGL